MNIRLKAERNNNKEKTETEKNHADQKMIRCKILPPSFEKLKNST